MPDKERADLILRELKKEKVINPGVQVRDVAIGLDGVLYLNLSKNLAEVRPGAPSEIVVVYSLVNSFVVKLQGCAQGAAPSGWRAGVYYRGSGIHVPAP